MKLYTKLVKRSCFVLIFTFSVSFLKAQSVHVMLVTGGHAFDTIQFFELFDAMEGVDYKHFQQPKANAEIANNLAEDYDVLVFYDMWKNISESEKAAYLKLTKRGKPLLFLHHSIVSYQDWPEFKKILGGKYFQEGVNVPEEKVSNYKHDVWVYSNVVNYTPVTKGFKELRFFDEIYGNVWVSDSVFPLLKTTHPKSMELVAWENKYNASTILYIQPGHDRRTFVEDDYRKLLQQAIQYLAKSN